MAEKLKPISAADVAETASTVNDLFRHLHAKGFDGQDIALGALSAVRFFAMQNTTKPRLDHLDELADFFLRES